MTGEPPPAWLTGLRQALDDQGMTWAGLADHIGIAPSSVARVFRGLAIPKADNMRKMVDGLFPAGSPAGQAVIDDYKNNVGLKGRGCVHDIARMRRIWDLHVPDDAGLCMQDGQRSPCKTRLLLDDV